MTDYQQARAGLGADLRALRLDAGLTVRGLAALLGWPPSKVSKLENGRQTATAADVSAFAGAVGRGDAAGELLARLRALDSHYMGWRRQLAAGTAARARAALDMDASTHEIWACETAVVPGLLQTAAYARAMLTRTAWLHGAPADVDAAVAARMERQHRFRQHARRLRVLLWEAALYMRLCPVEVMRDQLAHIAAVAAGGVEVGIVELGATLDVVPGHGFWIHDGRLVLVETIGAELRIEESAEVDTYRHVFEHLDAAAVHGPDVKRVLARAARTMSATHPNRLT